MARRLLIAILLLAALPAWPGCSSKNEPQQDAAATGSAPATASPQAAPDDEPELPPFVKPTLADVDAKADWQPMPVLDAMKLLALMVPDGPIMSPFGLIKISRPFADSVP